MGNERARYRIQDFDYQLPPERIAQQPLPERDASRLLLLERAEGAVRHQRFRDLPRLLRAGDLLVVNRSRVIPARLIGRREGGGSAEILLVRRRPDGGWDALARPGRRLRAGARIRVGEELTVHFEPAGRGVLRKVRLETAGDPLAVLERLGHTPLPPYIRRPDRPQDRERYQTVYAREPGSVAAPTAGLHFTPALLAALERRGIGCAALVLHVGPGTFRPVEVEDVAEHRVDPEPFWIPETTVRALAQARERGGRVIAVGTTTARALETAAEGEPGLAARAGETSLVIVPGFRFRVVDGLLTNFHLPRSSLLLVVCAFAGRESVLSAYAEAVRAGYRFYSYGDAMLIL